MKKRTIHHINRDQCNARAGMLTTSAELLIESARVVANPPPDVGATGLAASHAFVSAVLAAAKASGYKHTDSLSDKLLSGPRSIRLEEMARTACKFAGAAVVYRLALELESASNVHPPQEAAHD